MLRARGDKQAAKPGELSPASSIVIERFASEHGYITGVDNVVLVCVVRNIGTAPLTDNTLRLRCYPVAGLDYTVGNLLPVLPPLAPGQAVAYRWRLTPTDAHAALVAGVVLENQGAASPSASSPSFSPQLAFTVVPRLAHTPTLGDVPQFKDPLSHAGERDGSGLILNNHVSARILIGERREPLLVLGAKEGAVWRGVASSLPLLRVCLGEDGQSPWLQTFHCRQMRAREDKNSATLTLSGTVGLACRAELTLESRPDTDVIVAHLRLNALRSLRLAAVQLPALITTLDARTLPPTRSDGSPLLLTETPSPLSDEMRLAVAHSGATTFGVAWPADLPLPGWKWRRQPSADGGYTLNLGVQAAGDPRGDLIQAGTAVEFSFRLFAFAPSDTIRDATRFQIP